MSITEGMGVDDVSQIVKETLNDEDSFSLCDAKGVEIMESEETKCKLS